MNGRSRTSWWVQPLLAASAAGQGSNFGLTLLVVPAMYFVYVYYRMRILRAVLDNISNVSHQNESRSCQRLA